MKVDNQLPPRFIKLTLNDGYPIYLNPAYIVAFYEATIDGFRNVHTKILYAVWTDDVLFVCEKPLEILHLIEECYG